MKKYNAEWHGESRVNAVPEGSGHNSAGRKLQEKMITQSNRKFLSELVARLAFHDYYQANQENLKKPLRKDGTRPYTPYSLSDETLEALEMYKTACRISPTREDEEAVKAYILKAKFKEQN